MPEVESRGAGEIIITSISKEGTFQGLDLELIRFISSLTNLPVTYSGGFGRLFDLNDLVKENLFISGLAIAGTLHYEKLKIKEIRNHAQRIGIDVRKL